jgi:hypothetical protein
MVDISLLVKRQAEKILTLEFRQAQALADVLRASRNELNDKLRSSPNNLSYRQYLKVIDQHIVDLEAKLVSEGRIATMLDMGQQFGQQVTGQRANVPRGSVFWEPLPTLPLEALTIQQSRYIDLIREMVNDHKAACLQQIKIGLSQGEGISPIIDRLLGTGLSGLQGRDGVFRYARTRAELIGRTVTNDLVNRGALASYHQIATIYPEMDLKKQWVTTSDRRTSDRCTTLIGQIKELDENFQSADGWQGQNPPAHPQCRSRVISVPKKWDKDWKPQSTKQISKADQQVWANQLKLENPPPNKPIRSPIS